VSTIAFVISEVAANNWIICIAWHQNQKQVAEIWLELLYGNQAIEEKVLRSVFVLF
jgi:hypothetical protein